jgi:prophage antirepressor-like protein
MVTRNESSPRVFRYEDESFGRYWYIRVVGTSEAPEWVSADVVAVLYPEASPTDYPKYYAQVPPEWKSQQKILTANGEELLTTLCEPGLYYLIVQSNSAMAIRFQQWIAQEILPVIRPNGDRSKVNLAVKEEPSTKEKLYALRLAMDMLYELGGIDERTRLNLRDRIKTILQEDQMKTAIRFGSEPALPGSLSASPSESLTKRLKTDEGKSDNYPTNTSIVNNKGESLPS